MMRPATRGVLLAVLAVAAVIAAAAASLRDMGAASAGSSAPATSPLVLSADKRVVSSAARARALARAQVWGQPATPIAMADLSNSAAPPQVTCRFEPEAQGGTAPKFDCVLENGEEVRIKYGRGPEVHAEPAATRLLRALGFGSDNVALVESLRCHGCPDEPFSMMIALNLTRTDGLYRRLVNYDRHEDFQWVAMERKYPGRPIETVDGEGWALFELDAVDPAKGGAPRAHVDALRLMAVLLAHWDNKAENQRLVCGSPEWPAGSDCQAPFLLLQDVGATFGPSKIDLEAWSAAPIWEDRSTCTATMRGLPYDGATFRPTRITEEGRRLAADLLSQLSDRQLVDLFAGARFDKRRVWYGTPAPIEAWVQTFKDKVAEISEGPPCPAASS